MAELTLSAKNQLTRGLKARLMYVENKDGSIDGAAARATDGTIHLALVNVDPDEAADVTVDIDGVRARTARGEVLTGPAMDTHNSFAHPDAIKPAPFAGVLSNGHVRFHLPPKSIAMVALR